MLRGLTAAAAASAALLVFVAGAEAAPPPNDAFAAAQPLGLGQQVSAVNLEATAEVPGEPDPEEGDPVSNGCEKVDEAPRCASSVWYTLTPATGGEYTVETCDGGTDIDSILAVYSGATLATLKEEASNDDDECVGGGGTTEGSRVSFTATAGTTYHVELTGYRGDEGSFYLRAYPGAEVAAPTPDTQIERGGSYALAANASGNGPGVLSGPRHSASFALVSDPPGAGFECSLDGAPFAVCATPVSYDSLAAGSSHTFAARANAGGAIDATPVIERFSLDSSPPESVFSSGPRGEIKGQSPEWKAESSERNNAQGSFRCRLDGQPGEACPPNRKYSQLCNGPHSFSTAAVDRASNVDPSPVTADILVTEAAKSCAAPAIEKTETGLTKPTITTVGVTFDDEGAGGTLHVEYGTTPAYGSALADASAFPAESPQVRTLTIPALEPGTQYHFNVRLTTPFGSTQSGDQTFTTAPLGAGSLPTIQNGTPNPTGAHAAALPVQIDTHGVETELLLSIATAGPITIASPILSNREDEIAAGATVPQSRTIQVTDLEPSTNYHYRLLAVQRTSDSNAVLGPEGTFTTPPFVAVTSRRSHFRLSRKDVRLGKLTRRTRVLRARVRGLPKGTVVRVKLKAGKRHVKARKKEKLKGTVKFKLHLSKKLRKALHDPRLKRARVTFTASPPGDTTSRVVFRPKLKR